MTPTRGGSGETVAIVDAFDDPNIERDLEEFSIDYGLPACTDGNRLFQEGRAERLGNRTRFQPEDTNGWSVEDIARRRDGARGVPEMPHPARRGGKRSARRTSGRRCKQGGRTRATEVSRTPTARPSSESGVGRSKERRLRPPRRRDRGRDRRLRIRLVDRSAAGPGDDELSASMPERGGSRRHDADARTPKASGRARSSGTGTGLNDGDWQEGASGGGCSIFFEAPALAAGRAPASAPRAAARSD